MRTKLAVGGIFLGLIAVALIMAGDQSAKPQTRLTKIQQEFCYLDKFGELNCDSPGTGVCWAKGGDPFLDQKPAVANVGNPDSPDFGKQELCSGFNDRYPASHPYVMEAKPGDSYYSESRKNCENMLADGLNVVCHF